MAILQKEKMYIESFCNSIQRLVKKKTLILKTKNVLVIVLPMHSHLCIFIFFKENESRCHLPRT